jgi:hypothetical protein
VCTYGPHPNAPSVNTFASARSTSRFMNFVEKGSTLPYDGTTLFKGLPMRQFSITTRQACGIGTNGDVMCQDLFDGSMITLSLPEGTESAVHISTYNDDGVNHTVLVTNPRMQIYHLNDVLNTTQPTPWYKGTLTGSLSRVNVSGTYTCGLGREPTIDVLYCTINRNKNQAGAFWDIVANDRTNKYTDVVVLNDEICALQTQVFCSKIPEKGDFKEVTLEVVRKLDYFEQIDLWQETRNEKKMTYLFGKSPGNKIYALRREADGNFGSTVQIPGKTALQVAGNDMGIFGISDESNQVVLIARWNEIPW